ncbi:DUF3043 domain-containing protein [Modestobacter sp. NPDC049651]|uniref:DUF3043 domain-containing protein n=1 Tax=unclassified Modestobacter TaxID=2643866 RepID=UPI0033E36A27
MKLRLPGRRPEPEATPDPAVDLTAQLTAAGGKGRPTPKRSEAQGRRQGPPPPPPATRKEALRRMREQRGTGADRRAAANRGEDRALPARDQGPRKKLVRDIVDSRRNVGSLFLLVAVLLLVSYAVPSGNLRGYASLVWFFFFLLIVADSIVLGRKIKKLVNERFPNHPESNRTLMWYGINRTTLPRKWRFPKAQVGPGAELS